MSSYYPPLGASRFLNSFGWALMNWVANAIIVVLLILAVLFAIRSAAERTAETDSPALPEGAIRDHGQPTTARS